METQKKTLIEIFEEQIMKTIKCQKCGYEWETNSKMIKVSCPSCGNKVKIREIENENA